MKKVIKLSLLAISLLSLTSCKEEVEPEKPEIIGEGKIVVGTVDRHKFDGRPAPKIAVTEIEEAEKEFKSKFEGDYFINKGEKRKIREDYTVGMDFKEGYYLLEVPNKNNGYYKIIRDGTNYEKTFENFYIVNLKKGDYFKIDNVIVSRLENPHTSIQEKLLSGIHEMGKDLEKTLYKTSDDFEGYLLSSFYDNSDGPNVQVMEKNKKYELKEIGNDNSIVFITKGFMQKDKLMNAEQQIKENTGNNTEIKTAKPTEKHTESDVIEYSGSKTEVKSEKNNDILKPSESSTKTDKFEIGV